MTSEEDSRTLGIQIANQIINIANNHLQQGAHPADIAAGLRHAAANFTAFAIANTQDPATFDPTPFAEEFFSTYAYYMDKHVAQPAPVSGLDDLIGRVKDES